MVRQELASTAKVRLELAGAALIVLQRFEPYRVAEERHGHAEEDRTKAQWMHIS